MEYDKLQTEKINSESLGLDEMTTLEAASLMNRMDRQAADAVEAELPRIAEIADMAAESFKSGGRLIYCGAGTSGRLGVLDASECVPTFGVPEGMVIGKIAGGDRALRQAVEGAEDDEDLGRSDLEELKAGPLDTVVAVSASGSAAYCMGALKYSRGQGAKTAGLCCVSDPAFEKECDVTVKTIVGPEIIMGSTRLRAGTAEKMVLNMISTLSMVKIGKVYGNLMVDLQPSNKKLEDRAVRIVMNACKTERDEAERLLTDCGGRVKTAIVCHKTGVLPCEADKALVSADGFVKRAVKMIRNGERS